MKRLLFIVLIALLFYTRFANLGWGLPYPMHPDERNMANAVQQLSCPSPFLPTTCLNPHFFAYGQLPLYLAYGGVQMEHFFTSLSGQPTFEDATIALRIISAFSSILLVFMLLRIIELIYPQKKLLAFVFLIFSPYAIQFAHFGTTESLLMLFYVIIIYLSLRLWAGRRPAPTVLFLGIISGLALGTKTSSLLFMGVPIMVIIIRAMAGGTIEVNPKRTTKLRPAGFEGFGVVSGSEIFTYLSLTLFFFILSSPQSFLNWGDFISSMNYESAIGLGTYLPFYTRQFAGSTPLLFQFIHILPYSLGWPTFIGALLGFFFLPSFLGKSIVILITRAKDSKRSKQTASQQAVAGLRLRLGTERVSESSALLGKRAILMESALLMDILRFSLLLSFLPPSFFFAKWTRFISPSFPLFSLFAILFFLHITKKNIRNITIIIIIIVIIVIPGFSYLSIYLSPDVRFAASEWIYKNIPANSKILSETANVVDLPIATGKEQRSLFLTNYLINSFNFYDLDSVPQLQKDLSEALNQADYIIVPSRRIFMNHPKNIYPVLSNYYEKLFSGSLGFAEVAEFSSYPRITILGKTIIEFPDEYAEETWTVFDHPVIRIFKKITNNKSQISNQVQITNLKTDFSSYTSTNYQLQTTNYHLLIADTPEKWEKGLMYVKNKQDINGLDGMLFTFPDSQPRTFWNKNTLSHLTLYWIQNKKVIGVSDLPSITETGVVATVSSPFSADTVIEIIK